MEGSVITDCMQLVNERYVNEPCTVCRKGITHAGLECVCCQATGRHRNAKAQRAEREHVYAEFAAKEQMWRR